MLFALNKRIYCVSQSFCFLYKLHGAAVSGNYHGGMRKTKRFLRFAHLHTIEVFAVFQLVFPSFECFRRLFIVSWRRASTPGSVPLRGSKVSVFRQLGSSFHPVNFRRSVGGMALPAQCHHGATWPRGRAGGSTKLPHSQK